MLNRIKDTTKNLTAFSLGMFIGVVYGSAVATVVAASMLGLP
jgi:hypothetical protein